MSKLFSESIYPFLAENLKIFTVCAKFHLIGVTAIDWAVYAITIDRIYTYLTKNFFVVKTSPLSL